MRHILMNDTLAEIGTFDIRPAKTGLFAALRALRARPIARKTEFAIRPVAKSA